VPGQSLAGWLLIGADGGAYREQLSTHWKDGTEAAQLLQRGEVPPPPACVGAGIGAAGDARFAIEPLPLPRMRDGWAVGMAVKKDATDLAQALQARSTTDWFRRPRTRGAMPAMVAAVAQRGTSAKAWLPRK
jgi:hypothetical protein